MAIAQARRIERIADRHALVGRVRGADLLEPRGECLGVALTMNLGGTWTMATMRRIIPAGGRLNRVRS